MQFNRQLSLPFSSDQDTLKNCLEKFACSPLSLTITDNATSMISVRRKADRISVRLHRMFLHAGPDICSELAQFIKRGRGGSPLIRAHIRNNSHLLRKRKPVLAPVNTAGEHHCLNTMFESVNRDYFGGKLSAAITWGRSSPRQRARMRTLGSYHAGTNTVRINPLLDRKTVPAYFLEFIVYHELLHAWLGVEERNGRRSIHSRTFRMYEKKFRQYERAMAWEKKRFGPDAGRRA